MNLINTQNTKKLAKAYSKQIHEKDLQISSEFISQVHELVEAVIKSNVSKQDNLLGTLKATEWGSRCLQAANKQLQEVRDDI